MRRPDIGRMPADMTDCDNFDIRRYAFLEEGARQPELKASDNVRNRSLASDVWRVTKSYRSGG